MATVQLHVRVWLYFVLTVTDIICATINVAVPTEEWELRGMTRQEYQYSLQKAEEYRKLILQYEHPENAVHQTNKAPDRLHIRDSVFLTGIQYEALIRDYRGQLKDGRRREKRKTPIFLEGGYWQKWDLPIHYAIHDEFADSLKSVIRAAIEHMENETVLEFTEVDFVKREGPTLWIVRSSKSPNVCSSCVGMCSNEGGGVLLGDVCAVEMGAIVHELGHTVGMFHEHSRPDRDKYIRMLPQNINATLGLNDQNFKRYEPEEMDLYDEIPFDLGSIMMYQTWAGSRLPEWEPVFRAADGRYKRTIGQRTSLSFFDSMAINMMYATLCDPPQECYHGGYPNPKNCSVCLCPEGLGGPDCAQPNPKSVGCSRESSTITVTSQEEQCIWSRDHDKGGYYYRGDTCSYMFKAPVGCDSRIKLRFERDNFSVYCNRFGVDDQCAHWVEVKYKSDLSERGMRYCCDNVPFDMEIVISEEDVMLVTFDARYSIAGNWYVSQHDRKGFKFCYSLTKECESELTEKKVEAEESVAKAETEQGEGGEETDIKSSTKSSISTFPSSLSKTSTSSPSLSASSSRPSITPTSTTSTTTLSTVRTSTLSLNHEAVTARRVNPTEQVVPASGRYEACVDICSCYVKGLVDSFNVEYEDYETYCPAKLKHGPYVPNVTAFVAEMVCTGHLEGEEFVTYGRTSTKKCVLFCN